MKSYTIGKNDAGQRLDKFITKTLPSLPQSLMYKAIRMKRIKVNGKRAAGSDRLNEGDVVALYLADELLAEREAAFSFLGAGKKLDVLYEDENVLALNKPAGLLSHPDESEYVDTLITRVQRYLYEKGEYDPADERSFAPALANRIDRNTRGVVLAAKNAEALRVLNDKLRDREIRKIYRCVLVGEPPKPEDTVTAYMLKDEAANTVRVSAEPLPGGRTMRTRYRVLQKKNGLCLAEVELLTGRTHQIRAHMAFLGCPLLGDGKYGSGAANRRYGCQKQLLCSYRTEFTFRTDAGRLEYLRGKSVSVPEEPFAEMFNG